VLLCAFNLGSEPLRYRLDSVPSLRMGALALNGTSLEGDELQLPPGGALLQPIEP
jgi:hypothetical protein